MKAKKIGKTDIFCFYYYQLTPCILLHRDIDEQADNQLAAQEINQLSQVIQEEITDFVNTERNLQVVDIPVHEFDLRQCFGIPATEEEIIDQSTAVTLGISQHSNGNGDVDPDDNANYVGNADDDEFDEEDLEEEYYGRPREAVATRLVPLMVYMLEHCNGSLVFPLTPQQPWGPVAIPFDHSFMKMFIQHFKHFATPQISTKQLSIMEAIQAGNHEQAVLLEQGKLIQIFKQPSLLT